ncbi:unnamed protein product [marine sediment metagenome]|uniref:Uncharacterized protein n=1 Tax=marine sediment metagenome TaxID=412755 RepID=X1DKR5_9ZZZZ
MTAQRVQFLWSKDKSVAAPEAKQEEAPAQAQVKDEELPF